MSCFASVAVRPGGAEWQCKHRLTTQEYAESRSSAASRRAEGDGRVGSRTRDSTVAAECVVVVGVDVGGKSADAVERPSSTCDGRTGSRSARWSRDDGLSGAPTPVECVRRWCRGCKLNDGTRLEMPGATIPPDYSPPQPNRCKKDCSRTCGSANVDAAVWERRQAMTVRVSR